MGINIDLLLTEIETTYRDLRAFSYPDSSSFSRRSCSAFGKHNLRATEYRNRGNEDYSRCEYRQALEWYTKSAASATENSEELALAYANRSAALFHLGEYLPSLLDMNRALAGRYPEQSHSKLKDRKKRCLMEIMKMGVKIVKICNETDPIDSTATSDTSNVPKGNFDNLLLPNTSSKIELAYDEKWGRHVVAAKDIEPGEILSCEKFFVTFLFSQLQWTNCSYCSMRCAALIPCPSCTQEMYCSQACLTRAFNSYHRTECKMWPFFKAESLTEDNLIRALRILYVGTEKGRKLKQLTATLTSIKDILEENVNPTNKPYAGDYSSILQLRRTSDYPSKALILAAVEAIIWLQRFYFFENNPDPNSMSETEIFATLAILNHLQLKCYTFGIYELTNPDDKNKLYETIPKINHNGAGVLALHALVNHSCDPNVDRVNTRQREQIIFSLRPIKKGEQIFISYCGSFAQQTLAKRKEELSTFGFTCYCKACMNDWPLIETMMRKKPEFFTTNMKKIKIIEAKNFQLTRDCTTEMNIENLSRWRKHIYNYICSPSSHSSQCEGTIINYMVWMNNM